MAHFISIVLVGLLVASTAQAGFEWVPPMNDPAPTQRIASIEPASAAMDMGTAFPPAAVTAEPLQDNSAPRQQISAPTSILPAQQAPQMAPTKNLSSKSSHKKLVINPYPLRYNKGPTSATRSPSMTEMYKAMNEQSGNLHPVNLGNGMSTGAKKNSAPIPQAQRLASTAHKTFLTPAGTGMTPMMGAEPAPLPGMGVPRAPVEVVKIHKNYAEAVGFGRDLPMALALSQVIPSEYTHSFAKNVDAGATVSWEGGKPWDQVLNDMLASKNMMAVIQNNKVTIQPKATL